MSRDSGRCAYFFFSASSFLVSRAFRRSSAGLVTGAARFQGNKVIRMHREIRQTPPDKVCDHVDTIGLNNRRCNLRNCDRRDNVHNLSRSNRGTSCFKGVFWDKRLKKWCAKICCDNKVYRLGCFDSEIDAALAYDRKARELFGAFARLNFPDAVG